MKIKSLPTEYAGVEFRSRAEARWAYFFTEADIPWEYEVEGFDLDGLRYLPDFWLPYAKCWFEVKGVAPNKLEAEKAWRLAIASKRIVLLAPGSPSKDVKIIGYSPTKKVVKDLGFAYAHEECISYICDCCWNPKIEIKLRETEANCGVYGYWPTSELEEAGKKSFRWNPEEKSTRRRNRRCIR